MTIEERTVYDFLALSNERYFAMRNVLIVRRNPGYRPSRCYPHLPMDHLSTARLEVGSDDWFRAGKLAGRLYHKAKGTLPPVPVGIHAQTI